MDAHDAAVRDELEHFHGREIETTGDGFLASFDGPARAIHCARAIRTRSTPSASKCVPGCTAASARSAATISPGSPCT